MAKTIWKSSVDILDTCSVQFPQGAKLLHIAMQNNEVTVWALVETTAPVVSIPIRIYGTGHPITDQPGKYLGTWQMNDGSLVFHAFTDEVKM